MRTVITIKKFGPIIAIAISAVLLIANAVLFITYQNQEPPEPIIEYIYMESEPLVIEVGTPSYYQEILDTITEHEINLLTRIVYHEARGESQLGKRAVAEVVLNRVRNDRFPNTIHSVLDAPNQFVPVSSLLNMSINEPAAYSACREAVELVLTSPTNVLDDDVVYFMQARSYSNKTEYERIGGHSFFYI